MLRSVPFDVFDFELAQLKLHVGQIRGVATVRDPIRNGRLGDRAPLVFARAQGHGLNQHLQILYLYNRMQICYAIKGLFCGGRWCRCL